jgi:hypothetical protein
VPTGWLPDGLRVASGWPCLEIANSRWQMARLSAFCILPSTFSSAWLYPALQGSRLEVQAAFDVGCWMLVAGCSGGWVEMVLRWWLAAGSRQNVSWTRKRAQIEGVLPHSWRRQRGRGATPGSWSFSDVALTMQRQSRSAGLAGF